MQINLMENKTKSLGSTLTLNRPNNVSPDLRYDHLKQFLDNVTSVINQHAAIINEMQGEIGKKITEKKFLDSMNVVTENINVFDPDLIKQISGNMKARNEKTGNENDDSINKLANKIALLTHGSTFFYKKMAALDNKQKDIENKMNNKLEEKDYKRKSKKFKEKIKNDFDELKNGTVKKLMEMESKFAGEIANFEEMTREVERKTLWKIQDCEELLKKRINNEYVDFSMKNTEDKLIKLINNITGGGAEQYERKQNELEQKLKSLEDIINEKIKLLKKSAKDSEQRLLGKFVLIESFDDQKKQIDGQFTDLLAKLKDFEKKNDPAPMLERQNQFIKQLETKLGVIEHDLLSKISELKFGIENIQVSENQNQPSINPYQFIDPHKICAMEADLTRLQSEVHEHGHLIKTLDEDFKNKLKLFDNELIEKLSGNLGKYNMDNGLNREEIIRLIDQFQPQFNIQDDESFKKLKRELMETSKRSEAMMELEKRVSRILKELDINNLLKQVKQKTNQDDFIKENAILENKLSQLSDQLNFLKKDIDHLNINFKKNITNNIQVNTNLDAFNTILSTKKIIPIQCLSCGLQTVPNTYSKGKVLGNDGKYYRAPEDTMNENNAKIPGGGFQKFIRPNTMQTTVNVQIPVERNNSKVLRPGSAKK